MQNQSTDTARTKEELALELVKAGVISIDADGRIWRHSRKRANGKVQVFDPPRQACHPDELGYRRVGVRVGGKHYTMFAHRLVWVAVNGRIPDGLEINHIDGNKSNNRLANLELMTRGDNLSHCIRVLGGHKHLVEARRHKLTWPEVREIRRLRREKGLTHRELGKLFGVSGVNICQILQGKMWNEKDDPGE